MTRPTTSSTDQPPNAEQGAQSGQNVVDLSEHASYLYTKEQHAEVRGWMEAARDEIKRLRVWAEDEQQKRHQAEDARLEARSEVGRLEATVAQQAETISKLREEIAGLKLALDVKDRLQ